MAKKTSFLGIDLGTSGIKVVELASEHKKPRLVTYGFSENLVSQSSSDFANATVAAAKTLRQVCQQAKTTSRLAIASLPSFDVHSSIITLPELPAKELKVAVEAEAKKIIPLPFAETIIDWRIIDRQIISRETEHAGIANFQVREKGMFQRITTREKSYVRILLTGTSKKLVQNFLNIFKEADLQLLSLETEDFALIRSLVGSDKSTVLLADLGATTTTFMIVQNGLPLSHHSLQYGGIAISKLLAESLQLTVDQTENLKRDLNTAKNLRNFPEALQAAYNPVLNDLKYVHRLYQQQFPTKPIEKVILTGGSAWLPNLPQFLADILNSKVYLGDPWARVVCPQDLQPILETIGPRFSIAVGLAMREIE
jgi:type IV pilus assembly protein PilM